MLRVRNGPCKTLTVLPLAPLPLRRPSRSLNTLSAVPPTLEMAPFPRVRPSSRRRPNINNTKNRPWQLRSRLSHRSSLTEVPANANRRNKPSKSRPTSLPRCSNLLSLLHLSQIWAACPPIYPLRLRRPREARQLLGHGNVNARATLQTFDSAC